MNQSVSCVALLVASLVLVGTSAAHALEADDVPAAVENAKTAADHEALAAYFDGEAKAARASAERHRRMAALYGKHPMPSGTKGVRAPLNRTMPPHCDKLVKSYEAAAAEYEAMAAAHREMASEVQ